MNPIALRNWRALWRAAGARGKPEPLYHDLQARYREPHRSYHTLRHLRECLTEFNHVRQLAQNPAAVEMALWFHDAVYNPRAADNEVRSAELADRDLSRAGCSARFIRAVRSLVLATKHVRLPAPGDAALVVDIDLSVLGKSATRVRALERGVRREYAWVPIGLFAKKRADILRRFAKRQKIYSTPWFSKKYEARARKNLAASIRALQSIAR